MNADSMRRPLAAGAVALALLLASACAGPDDDTSQAPAPTSSATLPADGEVPNTAGAPDPELPGDVVPIEFFVGDLAAVGNMKVIVEAFDRAADGRVTVAMAVENGALAPVVLTADSFRVYTSSGSSFLPDQPVARALAGLPVESTEWARGTLTFSVPNELRPVALLFDGSGYGERVASALIVLEPRPAQP